MPFRRRLHPVWQSSADSATFGYAMRWQPEDPYGCPLAFHNHVGLCDDAPEQLLAASAQRDSVAIDAAFQSALLRFAVDQRVYLSPATFEYAPHAAAWWYNMSSTGMAAGVVVVAMDVGAFAYLHERDVPVALLETVLPLQPCCLARLHMVPWRATNDVKVCDDFLCELCLCVRALKCMLRV